MVARGRLVGLVREDSFGGHWPSGGRACGGLQAQASLAHTRNPDGSYQAHPSAELLAVIDRLGSRPDNYAHPEQVAARIRRFLERLGGLNGNQG